MNILLVDKNSIRRYGTKILTNEVTIQANLYEASNDTEMFEILRYHSVSHLVYSYNMYKSSLHNTMKHIKMADKDLKVLLLTDISQSMLPEIFYHSGAHGLIPDDATISKFKRGLRTFFKYGKYIPNNFKMPGKHLKKAQQKTANLSLRTILSKKEYIVMEYIIQGLPLRQIAKEMDLAPTTINTFKARIYKKLSVNNINDVSAILNLSKLIA